MYVYIHLCCVDKVGHILKLGLSTRLFVLQGPEEDMEDESELTVTELKERRQLQLAAKELEELEYQQKEEERLKLEEEQGIDWGMGEFMYKSQLLTTPFFKLISK
jgi:protein phosphatase 1D